jgi:hypothetical protein
MKAKNAPWITAVCLALGIGATEVLSQQPQPASEVNALRERYKTEVDAKVRRPFQAAIDEVNKKQITALERAREAAQQGKKLDLALALDKEIESIKAGKLPLAPDDSSTPPVLRGLRSPYRRDIERLTADRSRKVRPYNEMYAKTLDSLITKLTTEGKLEEAKSAKVKRTHIRMDEMPPPPGVPALHEYLAGTKWLWNARADWVLTFLEDGTVDQADWIRKGLVTGWKVDNESQVTLSILKGRKDNLTATLVFAEDRLSFTGMDFSEKNPIAKSDRVMEGVSQ